MTSGVATPFVLPELTGNFSNGNGGSREKLPSDTGLYASSLVIRDVPVNNVITPQMVRTQQREKGRWNNIGSSVAAMQMLIFLFYNIVAIDDSLFDTVRREIVALQLHQLIQHKYGAELDLIAEDGFDEMFTGRKRQQL